MMLVPGGSVCAQTIADAAPIATRTPFYLYDERLIIDRCRSLRDMPHAYGLHVRYAMKANSGRAILQLISAQGLGIDASSVNEARRAHRASVPYRNMMLTTQEVPEGEDRRDLERMITEGLTYNACSLRQLELIGPLARQRGLHLAVRVNPGVGAGESATRNTGDKYSSFGIHLDSLPKATAFAREQGIVIDHVHVHIGSGGDPAMWRDNIDRMIEIVDEYFPQAETLTLGGGFKEARMPDEEAADIHALGSHAKRQIERFAERTGRRLRLGVEPGTYIVANAGYLVTRVLDRKSSGPDGFDFIVLDGGMEASTRPLLYGSRHPFHVVTKAGKLLSSEWSLDQAKGELADRVVVGRCCESGDCQTLDAEGHVVPRRMAAPEVGDYLVIGGAGAYCSAMCLSNYNSHFQAPEVLLRSDGTLKLIRKAQTLDQIVVNELGLESP